MTAPALTLEIIEVPVGPLARPTHSLILADSAFLSTLKQVEEIVASIKITDAQSAQQAADLTTRLTKAGSTLEKQRVALKAPYLALMSQIDTAAKAPANRIETAKRALSVLQTNFAQEQRRLAEEAERARQVELMRLEAIKAAEEKAAQEKAAQIAEQIRKQNEAAAKLVEETRLAGLPVVVIAEEENFDEAPEPIAVVKTETERQIEAIRFAPVVAPVKASGVRETVTLFPFLVDINLVPEIFVTKTLKLAAVQSTFCRQFRDGDKIPECPGIRFDVQRGTVSTGKGTF